MTSHIAIVGFHPDVPGLPAPAEVVRKGLDAAKAALEAEGHPTDLLMLRADAGDAAMLAESLRKKPYAVIVVGAGVRVPAQNLFVFEAVVNAIHTYAPQAAIAFNVNPEDSVAAAKRALPKTPLQNLQRGLRTVIYPAPDLGAAKQWYADLFSLRPYFDEPFYAGFNIGGYELGLIPEDAQHKAGASGAIAYWGVSDIQAASKHAAEKGAVTITAVEDVGGGILVTTVRDPFGNVLGLIENPHFPNV